MHRLFHDRRAVIATAVLALFSLILLAGSLGRMDFRPAGALGRSPEVASKAAKNLGELIQGAAEIPFWNQVIFWGILFLFVLLATSLLDPEVRKKLILAFIRMAIFALGILYLIKKDPDLFAGFLNRLTLAGMLGTGQPGPSTPSPVFRAPQVSGWFTFAVALGVVSLIVLLIWWFSRAWARIRELSAAAGPFDAVADIARRSIDELKSGANFENAIVECYARMSSVVAEQKGLHREHAMTPAEFSTRLTRAGLPRKPVEKLTALFESSRYGAQLAGPAEIGEAITSLTSILRYCGEES